MTNDAGQIEAGYQVAVHVTLIAHSQGEADEKVRQWLPDPSKSEIPHKPVDSWCLDHDNDVSPENPKGLTYCECEIISTALAEKMNALMQGYIDEYDPPEDGSTRDLIEQLQTMIREGKTPGALWSRTGDDTVDYAPDSERWK